MSDRRCRFCQKTFRPSPYQQRQAVCSEPSCQRQRRSEYRQRKLAADAEYRQVCRDSSRKWRAAHPDYWKQYREKNPQSVDRNREQQKRRDHKRHLRHLANNTSAWDLKHSAAGVWLLGPGAEDLANNNAASAQVWIIETLGPRKEPEFASCQQQRAGFNSTSVG
jgi:hypothetical protein